MNKTWKVSKYLLYDFKNAVIIYYGIIAGLAVMMVSTTLRLEDNINGEVHVGGLGVASIIFLFIAGLNCFKTSFKFMQANNVSRKRYFIANVITFLVISAIMAVIDVSINNVLSGIIPYKGFFEQLYRNNFFIADFIWSYTMFVLAAGLGWFVTMLYYRCSMLMKIIVSFTPLIVFILIGYVNNLTGGRTTASIAAFVTAFFSLDKLNPYAATVNVLVGTIVVIALCYLLIYRAPVKD